MRQKCRKYFFDVKNLMKIYIRSYSQNKHEMKRILSRQKETSTSCSIIVGSDLNLSPNKFRIIIENFTLSILGVTLNCRSDYICSAIDPYFKIENLVNVFFKIIMSYSSKKTIKLKQFSFMNNFVASDFMHKYFLILPNYHINIVYDGKSYFLS